MLVVLTAGALAGLVSAPHCALMCGPLSMHASRCGRQGQLRYQLARLVAYGIVGALVGWLGGPVVSRLWSGLGASAVSWALALTLGYAAYRSWPRKAGAAASDGAGLVQLQRPKASKSSRLPAFVRLLRRLPRRPEIIGALTPALPCGALWGGFVIAAGTGHPLHGALAMLAFGAASSPGLAFTGLLSRWLQGSPMRARVFSAALVVGVAFVIMRPMVMSVPNANAGADQASESCPLHQAVGQ